MKQPIPFIVPRLSGSATVTSAEVFHAHWVKPAFAG
ncbi:MAG: hypothetical protein JWQ40_4702 [Segetibacter sp.]|nr:hypothetical protein [Segetibacter sp.]